jgi:hypothetical protein
MNTVNLIIKDSEAGLEFEGHVEDQSAFDRPPTPALILGSYLAANAEQICKDAMRWFKSQVVSPPDQDAQ